MNNKLIKNIAFISYITYMVASLFQLHKFHGDPKYYIVMAETAVMSLIFVNVLGRTGYRPFSRFWLLFATSNVLLGLVACTEIHSFPVRMMFMALYAVSYYFIFINRKRKPKLIKPIV